MVSVDKSRVMVAAATGKTLRHKVQSKQMDSSHRHGNYREICDQSCRWNSFHQYSDETSQLTQFSTALGV